MSGLKDKQTAEMIDVAYGTLLVFAVVAMSFVFSTLFIIS